MLNAERILAAQAKEKETIDAAMQYNINDLESYIVALQPHNKGKRKNSSYTKRGPGRYHQCKSRREILRERQFHEIRK